MLWILLSLCPVCGQDPVEYSWTAPLISQWWTCYSLHLTLVYWCLIQWMMWTVENISVTWQYHRITATLQYYHQQWLQQDQYKLFVVSLHIHVDTACMHVKHYVFFVLLYVLFCSCLWWRKHNFWAVWLIFVAYDNNRGYSSGTVCVQSWLQCQSHMLTGRIMDCC